MQVNNNAEITALKQIIGLQHAKQYTDTKTLRYGKVMIMTDQDQDGSHIKGLIMNYLHHFYPSLLKVPGFLVEFITPIVKVHRNTLSWWHCMLECLYFSALCLSAKPCSRGLASTRMMMIIIVFGTMSQTRMISPR
jgi:DNA gyrase/topoisomerase IV subunit B